MARRAAGSRDAGRRSRASTPLGVVRQYIRRINAGDARGLAQLAGPKLPFVDATGAGFILTEEGWRAYFADFPDYRIEVEVVLAAGTSVAVFGWASGSFKGRGAAAPWSAWRVPAAWRAVVRAGKLVQWQVVCDAEPMLRSAGRARPV